MNQVISFQKDQGKEQFIFVCLIPMITDPMGYTKQPCVHAKTLACMNYTNLKHSFPCYAREENIESQTSSFTFRI